MRLDRIQGTWIIKGATGSLYEAQRNTGERSTMSLISEIRYAAAGVHTAFVAESGLK
jgi:hypothetical protein